MFMILHQTFNQSNAARHEPAYRNLQALCRDGEPARATPVPALLYERGHPQTLLGAL